MGGLYLSCRRGRGEEGGGKNCVRIKLGVSFQSSEISKNIFFFLKSHKSVRAEKNAQ